MPVIHNGSTATRREQAWPTRQSRLRFRNQLGAGSFGQLPDPAPRACPARAQRWFAPGRRSRDASRTRYPAQPAQFVVLPCRQSRGAGRAWRLSCRSPRAVRATPRRCSRGTRGAGAAVHAAITLACPRVDRPAADGELDEPRRGTQVGENRPADSRRKSGRPLVTPGHRSPRGSSLPLCPQCGCWYAWARCGYVCSRITADLAHRRSPARNIFNSRALLVTRRLT